MAISRLMIDAYKRQYSEAELATAQKIALSDRAAGVQITQVSFQDGGGSGTMISGDPNEVIETMEICLQEIAGTREAQTAALSAPVNFSARRFET